MKKKSDDFVDKNDDGTYKPKLTQAAELKLAKERTTFSNLPIERDAKPKLAKKRPTRLVDWDARREQESRKDAIQRLNRNREGHPSSPTIKGSGRFVVPATLIDPHEDGSNSGKGKYPSSVKGMPRRGPRNYITQQAIDFINRESEVINQKRAETLNKQNNSE